MIEDGDEITVDLNTNEINCTELSNQSTFKNRKDHWNEVVQSNDGMHPSIGVANTRLLNRMRRSAVSAKYGAGMHPDRVLWVKNSRDPQKTAFLPSNKYRQGSGKAF